MNRNQDQRPLSTARQRREASDVLRKLRTCVDAYPDRTATACGGGSLTYSEFDAVTSQIADRLAREGVGPNVAVALFARRSTEAILGIWGILKAGGAYVPLDPDYPTEWLAFMPAALGSVEMSLALS